MQRNATNQSATLAMYGLVTGIKTGALLSFIYSFIVFVMIARLEPHNDSGVFTESLDIGGLFFAVMLYAFIIAILPSIAIGAITGTFIGFFAGYMARRYSLKYFIPTGIFICVVFAILVNTAWMNVFSNDSFQMILGSEYFFYISIPSIIYTIAGIFLTIRFYHKRLELKSQSNDSSS